MTFPSITSALSYLRSKIADFKAQDGVLKDRLIKVGNMIALARKTNDTASLGKLTALKAEVMQAWNDHAALADKLQPYFSYIEENPSATVGFIPIPVALLGGSIAAASMLYLFYERIQNQKQALDMIAKGMLTPSEAEAIVNPGILKTLVGGGGIGGLTLYAAIGFGVYFFFVRKP